MTKRISLCARWSLTAALSLGLSAPWVFSDETPGSARSRQVPVTEARRQAEVLHSVMHATLQRVHHRYYREDEGLPIPAAVLSEVFDDIAEEEQVQLRWLVVEGQPMNTDHNPQDQFERDAVAALKAGKSAHEEIAVETYRRAAPITLSNHCLKCHVPDRKSTEDRTAGLIITIPLQSNPTSAAAPAK